MKQSLCCLERVTDALLKENQNPVLLNIQSRNDLEDSPYLPFFFSLQESPKAWHGEDPGLRGAGRTVFLLWSPMFSEDSGEAGDRDLGI